MTDNTSEAFRPINTQTKHRDTIGRLQDRAQHPDLWAEQWSDDPALLVIHNRIGPIIWVFYCKWPNAFFIPGDDVYTMLDSGYFESLDQVEFIMTLEEKFDVRIDDELANKIFPSPYGEGATTYRRLLVGMLEVFNPDQYQAGSGFKWHPLSLPPDYFEKSLWNDIKRHLPFAWTDDSLHRELTTSQAKRPLAWPGQWAGCDDRLIQLRDRVSPILVDELQWLDDRFIPHDCLEAVFHSRRGLEHTAAVLNKINNEFKSDVDLEFITSGRHTYVDFLKKLSKTS